jgi:hypothetical protein
MPTYTFANEEHTHVTRANDDGSFASIPWSTDPVQPLNVEDSVAGRQWLEDGSPTPAPYKKPEK